VNEARAVASLDHPNILKIFDVGGETYPYFVMEYLEGISMESIVSRKKRLDSRQTRYYALQIADAVRYCHERGIIHRDIKPANIVAVNRLKTAKLVDFGIARDTSTTGLTQSNVSIGSPPFMAPEQIRENRHGVPSDIYAFGVTLYRMVSGELPFRENEFAAKLTRAAPPIADKVPGIDTVLASLIMKCVESDPGRRFENFVQILEELKKAGG
jgi:serine/threonine-protein kinase